MRRTQKILEVAANQDIISFSERGKAFLDDYRLILDTEKATK
jgi:hypothetical protein